MMEAALQTLFLSRFGVKPETAAPLLAHGSARKLWRLAAGDRSVIGAYGPDRQENRAFLAFSRHFRAQGLKVPEILAEDEVKGIYLEEDLGDTTLFEFLAARRKGADLTEEVLAAYRSVVRELPRFQIDAGRTLDYSLCYPRPAFDRQSMVWDLNYFKYYFLRLAKIPFDEQALEDDFQRFADFLLAAPRDFFLYRDFQSRNVMLRGGEPWFIDYQGGRKGALQYDIASLLVDAKADLPFEVRDELLARYLEAAAARAPLDKEGFLRFFPGFVHIRIMQAMGAYGLRGFYEGKTQFLQSIPYAIRNLERLLRTTELPLELPALEGVWRRLVASSALRQLGSASLKLTVRVQSFSYKNGLPVDDRGHGGGFVFDCRAMPNPGKEERFAALTGRDKPVAEYLEGRAEVARFLEAVEALLGQTVESYKARNFTDLFVGFGCTGGQHRSVYCAERVAKLLRKKHGVAVELAHRELGKRSR